MVPIDEVLEDFQGKPRRKMARAPWISRRRVRDRARSRSVAPAKAT